MVQDAATSGGGYQLGFKLTPLTADGGLDTSGDFMGGPHPWDEDPLYKMALENRDGGNKMVQAGEYEQAVARYSEMIVQTKTLGEEKDVQWTDEGRVAVRQLRAAAYLNLSLCFLKTEQWTHANNTASRALEDPYDPQKDTLAPKQKAKALFRRAQAQSKGFSDYEKATEDLKKALEYTPDDKEIQQELVRIRHALAKSTKAADKKLAGFLSGSKLKDGEGIFGDSVPSAAAASPAATGPEEPVKLSDGLWVMPKSKETAEAEEAAAEADIDYEELGREITEMKEEKPEVFAALRDRVKDLIQEELVKEEGPDEKEEATTQ